MTDERFRYLLTLDTYDFPLILEDHWGGVDQDYRNPILDKVSQFARDTHQKGVVILDSPWQSRLQETYPDLEFRYRHITKMWDCYEYRQHPDLRYENFVCSLNGSNSVERRLLTSALHRRGWFDIRYGTKNFQFDWDQLWGDLKIYCEDRASVYAKFFLSPDAFNQTVVGIDYHKHPNHTLNNLMLLDKKITKSFVNVSTETKSMSYHPFYTEKFLFSVVTRGLFVFFAQPGWHQGLVDFYGFRLYNKLFEYDFDLEPNPILRMTKLLSMLSRFDGLSFDDWQDLYLVQQDDIEYNYDRYFSRDWLSTLDIDCATQYPQIKYR